MNPLFGLAGIAGIAGILFLFGSKITVDMSCGNLYEKSPKVSMGQVFPKVLWRVLGLALILCAVGILVFVLKGARL